MHAITTIARHGLVVVHIDGEPYRVVDIGMRMLEPHELAKAQGLPDGYALPKTKRDAIKLIGNSVCPPVIRAIYEANLHPESKVEAA
jgi:DNA (cytosine-5)-methyltransferase 1